MKTFVFIPGLRGPEGQILHDEPMTGEGKSRQKVLFRTEIDDKVTLDQAVLKFKEKVEVSDVAAD